jgi:hypothetical protein
MKPWRLEECARLSAIKTVGEGADKREVVWIVSAGELLDHLAHTQIWRRGSAAEQCETRGQSRYWDRDQVGRTKEMKCHRLL